MYPIEWERGGYLTWNSPILQGEIVIGGPYVTLGYLRNKEKIDESYSVIECWGLNFNLINIIIHMGCTLTLFSTGEGGQ